ncbi:hypothetical protein O181_093621 [Austropuccinia psidii MF-1]|uniref:Uncharacterized protein n=1 Tax=Austropuccinia psidii MF-1 TaxID=1389203 RepID=A0A9Q3J1T9_9BASI|nr:hypothetical protein [Austropuccinia psidii MF-1]
MPPYACPGSRRVTRNSLCLSRIPTVHTQNLALGQPSNNACPGSQCFTHKILMLVQAPDNSKNTLCRGSLPTAPTLPYVGIHAQILTLVQVLKASHTHPYACTGSQQLIPFLTPGQPPNNSKTPYMTKIDSM